MGDVSVWEQSEVLKLLREATLNPNFVEESWGEEKKVQGLSIVIQRNSKALRNQENWESSLTNSVLDISQCLFEGCPRVSSNQIVNLM